MNTLALFPGIQFSIDASEACEGAALPPRGPYQLCGVVRFGEGLPLAHTWHVALN